MPSTSIEPSATAPGPLVSICIANYNYGRFLGAAIESALAQTYEPIEVVVVDDGSTDDSAAVMLGFGDRIVAHLAEHRGQGPGMSMAYELSQGEIVFFLDADDLLAPMAAEAAVAAMSPDVSKVQFRLEMIDAAGKAFGVFPGWGTPLPSGNLAEVVCTWFDAGGVGNDSAYSRWFLRQIMPIPVATFSQGGDAYPATLAPLYGRIVSLDELLGSYRSHGDNHSAASGSMDLPRIHWRVCHELDREALIIEAAGALGRRVHPGLALAKPEHALLRLMLIRLQSDLAIPGDHRVKLAFASIHSALRHPYLARKRRVLLTGLTLIALLCPRVLVRRAGDRFLAPRST